MKQSTLLTGGAKKHQLLVSLRSAILFGLAVTLHIVLHFCSSVNFFIKHLAKTALERITKIIPAISRKL